MEEKETVRNCPRYIYTIENLQLLDIYIIYKVQNVICVISFAPCSEHNVLVNLDYNYILYYYTLKVIQVRHGLKPMYRLATYRCILAT